MLSGTMTSSPGPIPSDSQSQMKRRGARGQRQRMLDADVLCERLLKLLVIDVRVLVPATRDCVLDVVDLPLGDRRARNGNSCWDLADFSARIALP